ncbi:MAG: putative Ig domain-containing protein [Polaromonas sp.]
MEYVFRGQGQYEFADGSVVSLGQLIAMSPPAPSFDTGYTQFHVGMGHQMVDARDTGGIQADTSSMGDLQVQSDGLDLVISINNGQDSLRLTGWYSDPGDMPRTVLTLGNDSFLSPRELTSKGLVKDGTAGNQTLYGVPGFATTFIAGPNSTMVGASGNDIYIYNVGSGVVHITDPGGGTLHFGAGITAEMVSLGVGSLLLTIGNQGDVIHLDGFDPSQAENFSSVYTFQFEGGLELSFEELLEKGFDIRGTAGDDTLVGTNLVDRFYSGAGNDTLIGGAGQNTYHFVVGDGHDTIEANDAESGSVNVVAFGVGVNASDVIATRVSDDLLLAYGLNDTVTVKNWFLANAGRVEQVSFEDGTVWGYENIQYEVNRPKAPVVSTVMEDQVAVEKTEWSFVVPEATFVDRDAATGDVLTYSASLANGDPLPSWMSFDAQTRTFTGMPGNAQVGNLVLKIVATDGTDLVASDEFVLTVINVNDAPVAAAPIDAQAATEDAVWSFTVPASTFADADVGDILSFSASLADGSTLPAWLNFDAVTRTFSGTPGNADVGSLSLKVTATDVAGAAVSSNFNVTVAYSNDGRGDITTIQYDTHGVKIGDTWSKADGSHGSDTFNADGSSSGVSYNADGSYSILASDAQGNTSAQNFSASGVLTGDSWSQTNGIFGSDNFNSDGSTESKATYNYADGSNLSTDTVAQADGSYQQSWSRSDGSHGTSNLNAATGETTGSNVSAGDSPSLSWVSFQLADGAWEVKETYSYADGRSYSTDAVNQPDGSYQQSWNMSDGSYGSYTCNADGSISGSANYADGSYRSYSSDDEGNNAMDKTYNASGVLMSDMWSTPDGRSGFDTFDADGTTEAQVTYSYADGSSYSTYTETQADGSYQQSWNKSDGSNGTNYVSLSPTANDVYQWGRGQGLDTIQEQGGTNRLEIAAGVSADQLWFRQDGNNLDISILGTNDQMVVYGWYANTANQLDRIELSDGEALLNTNVQKLVDAMASFAPPAAGQTQYTPQESQALAPVLAANWY